MTFPVAIAGRAWRTPLGDTVDDAMARLYAGERAAVASDAYGTQTASIRSAPAKSRQARFLRRMGLHAMDVAREALGGRTGDRVGLFSGVGGLRAHWDDMMAALANQRDDGERAWERGLRDIHPYWMLRHLSNNAHALAAAELGVRGEGATFGGANAGAQALAAAARALHAGAIDTALVIAYDSLLEPETLVELTAKRSIGGAAPAYDERAAGFVPGEAAAAIVLERDGDVMISVADAADGSRGEPSARTLVGAAAALVGELASAAPESARGGRDLAFVDGAARAWPELDLAERTALAELVGEVPLTAITAAMGQLGAATALVQAIALAEALRRGLVPPIAGLERPAAGPLVPVARAVETSATTALGVSVGAPGLAAAILVEVRR